MRKHLQFGGLLFLQLLLSFRFLEKLQNAVPRFLTDPSFSKPVKFFIVYLQKKLSVDISYKLFCCLQCLERELSCICGQFDDLLMKIFFGNISLARDGPIIFGNKYDEQPSAQKASCMKGVLNVALGTEYTASQRAREVTPKPIAGPLMAAMISLGKLINSSTRDLVTLEPSLAQAIFSASEADFGNDSGIVSSLPLE